MATNNPSVYPAATTLTSSDNPVALGALTPDGSPVHRVRAYNNGTTTVYFAYDTPAALGFMPVFPGAFFEDDTPCGILHVFCTANVALNGSSVGLTIWGVI